MSDFLHGQLVVKMAGPTKPSVVFLAFEKQKNISVCVISLALLHTMSHVMNLIKI